MTKVFISYHRAAEQDRGLAHRLHDALVALGCPAFIDTQIEPGSRWGSEIERALTEAELVVVLLSKRSVTRDFIFEEVRRAVESGKKILPVRVRFNGQLPYEWSAQLTPLQHMNWESRDDDNQLVQHVLRLTRGAPQPIASPPSEPPCGTSLLTDNWLLEDVVAILLGGVGLAPVSRLDLDLSSRTHKWSPVSRAGVQLEALIFLLTEIVLREKLIVDSGFIGGWMNVPQFKKLRALGILEPIDFRQAQSGLSQTTTGMVDALCVTESLRSLQSENEQSFAERRRPRHRLASQVIWGTAGYLARAHLHELVYSGHPLRRHLLAQTVSRQQWDANVHLEKWLNRHRVRLFEAVQPGLDARGANLVVPPIAVEVIEASSDLSDLIPNAIELRQKYAQLRGWLSAYQRAMVDEDPRALLKHKRDLEEIANALEHDVSDTQYGNTQVSFSVGWRASMNPDHPRVSIRTLLGNLIFKKKGETTIRRLLRMLEVERNEVGREALEYLRSQMSSART